MKANLIFCLLGALFCSACARPYCSQPMYSYAPQAQASRSSTTSIQNCGTISLADRGTRQEHAVEECFLQNAAKKVAAYYVQQMQGIEGGTGYIYRSVHSPAGKYNFWESSAQRTECDFDIRGRHMIPYNCVTSKTYPYYSDYQSGSCY